jgi:hypothetical protein
MNETEKVLALARIFGLSNEVIGYPDFEFTLLRFLSEYFRRKEETEFLRNVNHQGGIC